MSGSDDFGWMRNTGRRSSSFDRDWKFHLGDIPLEGVNFGWLKSGTCVQSGSRRRLDDSGWRRVDLPHDYAVESSIQRDASQPPHDPASTPEMWDHGDMSVNHGSLAVDIAWYRKRFEIAADDAGKRTYIQFDGAFRNTRTFLNDHFVGDHVSGFTGFSYDITDFIDYGATNLLAVRVDPREPEGWYYEGAGLYRHVWLIQVNPLHIAPWGVFVRPVYNPDLPNNASISISVTIRNRMDGAASVRMRVALLDMGGILVKEVIKPVQVAWWDDTQANTEIHIDDPHLWFLEDPYLYTCLVEIWRDDHLCDSIETPVGIRSAVFDATRGFLLNGVPVKLKGMCMHQDHACVGTAVPEDVQEYRIRRLKEMGCNAYRTAHHPPSPELLDICDRLGMLVMAENRLLSSASEYLRQLTDMIQIHRNHPSVVLWSIGNEEMMMQTKPEGARIARTLRSLARKLDPTRPVTMALVAWDMWLRQNTELETLFPIAEQLDVMGFNYVEQYWIRHHELYPEQPIVITEATSTGATRGCYERDDTICRLSNYSLVDSVFKIEGNWRLVAEHDFLSGLFIWTGFDYRGEPAPYSWPAVASNFGVMDSCGFPKDIFYYYQSQWTHLPVAHLFPHWNHPGKEGEPLTLYCFTNAEEVELFVNGSSYGKKPTPPFGHIAWQNVLYEPGVVEAVAYRAGREWARDTLVTTGVPHAVRLYPDRKTINSNGALVINVAVTDASGHTVVDANNLIYFDLDGGGLLLGTGNGDPTSHEPDKPHLNSAQAQYQSWQRRAFNGWCQVIVQASMEAGELTIVASSQGLCSDKHTFEVYPAQ